ncbi:hypothetical protein CUJ83_06255 [Methanocella sp. CWC-04]|uniref:Carboxypeptidase regulatory-like domain-containing protein n=2 Tax=Methanooceanicella nereidis TaxID=2052831 RepID=A0AAP2RBS0_9EURY|nr:hypothetical protein [Methanocella sp. CWC-04]
MAFIVPLQASQATAQMPKTVTISGVVYNYGTTVGDANVYLLDWDGSRPGATVSSGKTGDGEKSAKGTFKFTGVLYDPAKPFNFCIKAEKDGKTAYVLVYIIDPYSQDPIVAPVKIDISQESWKCDLTGTVQNNNLYPEQSAQVTLYERDIVNDTKTKVNYVYNPIQTGGDGGYVLTGVPYGYYTVEAEKNGMIGTGDIVIYKQDANINIILSEKAPTPTPTPTAPAGGSGVTGLPGFELVAALLAFLGAAYTVRKM